MKLKFLLAAVLCCGSVSAQGANNPYDWVLGMELSSGGDKLATLYYNTGDSADIYAGELFTFYGGMVFHHTPSFDSKITIGYMFAQANASNGSVKFTRYPLDYVASYVAGRHRIGAGLTYHLNPTFSQSDFGYEDVSFDDSLGYLAEYSFKLTSNMALGLRYEVIKYKPSSFSGDSVDGSHFGINFDGEF